MVVVLAVLAPLAYLLAGSTSYWSRRGLTQVRSLPLVGSSLAYMAAREFKGHIMQRWYREARAQGQSCVGVYLGPKPALILVDPDLLKTVMVKDFSSFTDRGNTVETQSSY